MSVFRRKKFNVFVFNWDILRKKEKGDFVKEIQPLIAFDRT